MRFDGGDCEKGRSNDIHPKNPIGYQRFDSHRASVPGNYNHYLNSMYYNTIRPSNSLQIPCSTSCVNNWIGDSFCDRFCNNIHCGFDAGDCGYQHFYEFLSELTFNGTILDVNAVNGTDGSSDMRNGDVLAREQNIWIFPTTYGVNDSSAFYLNFTQLTTQSNQISSELANHHFDGKDSEVTRFQVIDEDGSNCTKLIRRIRLDRQEQILTILLLPQFFEEKCENISLRIVLTSQSHTSISIGGKVMDGRDWDQKIQLQFIREGENSLIGIGGKQSRVNKVEMMTKNNNLVPSSVNSSKSSGNNSLDISFDTSLDKSLTTNATENGFNISLLLESKRQIEGDGEQVERVEKEQIDGGTPSEGEGEINELQEESSKEETEGEVQEWNDFVTFSLGSTSLSTGNEVDSFLSTSPLPEVLTSEFTSIPEEEEEEKRGNNKKGRKKRSPEEQMSQTMINETKGDSDQGSWKKETRTKGRTKGRTKVIGKEVRKGYWKKVQEEGKMKAKEKKEKNVSSHQTVSSGVQLSSESESWKEEEERRKEKDNSGETVPIEKRSSDGNGINGERRDEAWKKYNPIENHVDLIKSHWNGKDAASEAEDDGSERRALGHPIVTDGTFNFLTFFPIQANSFSTLLLSHIFPFFLHISSDL